MNTMQTSILTCQAWCNSICHPRRSEILAAQLTWPPVVHYVPLFGTNGLFVAMGGDTVQSTAGLISFDTVAVFDPEKQQWFNQTTTGSPPTARIEFCTAGLPSTNGTYEMYV